MEEWKDEEGGNNNNQREVQEEIVEVVACNKPMQPKSLEITLLQQQIQKNQTFRPEQWAVAEVAWE